MTDLQPILPEFPTDNAPLVIAGPCSAESCRQMLDTAIPLAEQGIKIFRAGIWKPRTMPGGFEGIGSASLKWLKQVKKETGMLTTCEVANKQHVTEALDAETDILWIGARTTANPFAVQEIADAISKAGRRDIAVLIKNPINPQIELWIGALQRFYNAGIRRIAAVHRGFSTYGKQIYRNMPGWHIPVDLRLRYPALPLICDPSHIGGKRNLVQPLSQQAMDMGFDGLMIECHCKPEEALSDAGQQLTPQELKQVLSQLKIRRTNHPTERLTMLRQQIDMLDGELLEILGRRLNICREIGEYKLQHNMKVVQSERFNDILQKRIDTAEILNLNPEFLRAVLLAIHDESVNIQMQILQKNKDL